MVCLVVLVLWQWLAAPTVLDWRDSVLWVREQYHGYLQMREQAIQRLEQQAQQPRQAAPNPAPGGH